MPRGGRRRGAGRKAGAVTRRTREVADRVHREGLTPLDVLLSVMRAAYEAKDYDKAVEVATRAAPYVHPRLAATQVSTGDPCRREYVVEIVEAVESAPLPRAEAESNG